MLEFFNMDFKAAIINILLPGTVTKTLGKTKKEIINQEIRDRRKSQWKF